MRFWIVFIISAIFSVETMAQNAGMFAVNNNKNNLEDISATSILKRHASGSVINRFPRPDSTHSPGKAIIRSLILPGWGQVYNHHWWKVPVIYGGFVALGSVFQYNLHYYNVYLNEALLRQSSPTATGSKEFAQYGGGAQAFFNASDANRRNYQLSILGFAGLWGLNCIDAYIDAKFRHSYSVDNDLAIKATPAFISTPIYAANNYALVPGVKLTFTLK